MSRIDNASFFWYFLFFSLSLLFLFLDVTCEDKKQYQQNCLSNFGIISNIPYGWNFSFASADKTPSHWKIDNLGGNIPPNRICSSAANPSKSEGFSTKENILFMRLHQHEAIRNDLLSLSLVWENMQLVRFPVTASWAFTYLETVEGRATLLSPMPVYVPTHVIL